MTPDQAAELIITLREIERALTGIRGLVGVLAGVAFGAAIFKLMSTRASDPPREGEK